MLSPETFANGFALICDRFNRPKNRDLDEAYYGLLREHLTDREFGVAVRAILFEDQFFPPPKRFVDIIKGSLEDQAELEWAEILTATEEGRPADFTPAGRAAYKSLGGFTGMQDMRLGIARREFIKAFLAHARAFQVVEYRAALTETTETP